MSSDGSSDEDIPGLESVSSSEVGSEMAVPLSDFTLFFFGQPLLWPFAHVQKIVWPAQCYSKRLNRLDVYGWIGSSTVVCSFGEGLRMG